MTKRIKIKCGDKTVTIKRLDNGDVVVDGIDVETERSLAELGFDKHPCLVEMDELMCVAANKGDHGSVELFIQAGADVHVDEDKALRWAVINGHVDVVMVLLEAGIDVNVKNNKALLWAVSNSRANVVKVLLEAGADVHVNNDKALRWAKVNKYYEVVDVLEDWIEEHG